ncbi:hypothetical protein D3C73_1283550 [compost metagenome]
MQPQRFRQLPGRRHLANLHLSRFGAFPFIPHFLGPAENRSYILGNLGLLDEGSFPLLLDHHPLIHQFIDRLAYCHPADTILLLDFHLDRDGVPRLHMMLNPLF